MKRILIDLEDSVVEKIDAEAKREKRKRKTQIEYVINTHAKNVRK